MKILTFCSYFEPEIAASMYLTTNLFEDAANDGLEVELFAPTPTRGVDKETIEKYNKIKYEERCGGKLKIHRFAMMQEGKKTLGRAFRYILLNLAFVWKGLRTKADVMFIDSTPPTQGFMAAFLKKMKRIPIVYNLQDIFPDSLVHTGISTEDSLAYKIGRWMEKVTYKNADKIIVISEDFKANIMAKGVPEDKIVVVYNWVDESQVYAVDRKDNVLFDEYGLDRNKFYVSYSGNIGLTQNMELLVNVAEKMSDYSDIGFVVVGDGAYKEELEKQVKERGLKNITLIPFQPYEKIASVFSIGDAGLIISKSGVGNNSVPSKTWSYMAAKTPILASFDAESELVKFVNENNCGVCVPADEEAGLMEAILEMKQSKDKRKEWGENGRSFIDANLSRHIGTSKYIDVIKNVK
ncbi:MAG: glycosyltransferase family 4 protein [Clostridia bacterium]|nr:glycosyltransferase family 4 protein [Clostridia bacterium]